MPTGLGRILAQTALVAGLIAAVLVIVAGPGTRFGIWNFRVGLGLLLLAVVASGAAIAVALVAFLAGGDRGTSAAAVFLGLLTLSGPLGFVLRARAVPMIHDISTDTVNPPQFVAVTSRRPPGSNPLEYGGTEVARAQHKAYPDLSSLDLQEPPESVLKKVAQEAAMLRWEIVAVDEAAGSLEATDTTAWFGFKDDVVVRVRPNGGGSRIDVRSVSRVGKSDVGANAQRIRRFLALLSKQPS
jgi:uncharacterized protein (DUF1499 family)